mmetsp:Transcript_45609/g.108537  ORF Transcript_45609/g.108537 Transcript_45609/m.108537 type:complete len:416 (+) Transcript_45609:131-1378(+)
MESKRTAKDTKNGSQSGRNMVHTSSGEGRRVVIDVNEEDGVACLKERLAKARHEEAAASTAAAEMEAKANLLRQELEDAQSAVKGYRQDCARLQEHNAQLQQMVEKLTQEMAQKDTLAKPSARGKRSSQTPGAASSAAPTAAKAQSRPVKELARENGAVANGAAAAKPSTRSARTAKSSPRAADSSRPSTARAAGAGTTASKVDRPSPGTARTAGATSTPSRGDRSAATSRGRVSGLSRSTTKESQPSRGSSPISSGRTSSRAARNQQTGATRPMAQAVDQIKCRPAVAPSTASAEQAAARAELIRRRDNLDDEIRQLESLAMQVQELEPLLLEAWTEAKEARASGANAGQSVSTLGLEVEAMVEAIERSLHLGPAPPVCFRDLPTEPDEEPGGQVTLVGSRLNRILGPTPTSGP